MSSRGYKPGELFRRAMVARVPNPSRNDTECQEDSQGNSLAAGVADTIYVPYLRITPGTQSKQGRN